MQAPVVDDARTPLLAAHQSRSPGLDDASVESTQLVIVYRRRWYVLFAYTAMAMTQGMVWNTWAPIAASTEQVFGWTDQDIALLTNWGPITYIISIIFFTWLMDVKGKDDRISYFIT